LTDEDDKPTQKNKSNFEGSFGKRNMFQKINQSNKVVPQFEAKNKRLAVSVKPFKFKIKISDDEQKYFNQKIPKEPPKSPAFFDSSYDDALSM
jgi:hypothetical protein